MKPIFRKTKSKKTILAILIPVVLISAIFFAVRPLCKKLYNAKNDLARENLVLDNLIEEGKKVDKYKELEDKMQVNSQVIDGAIVKKDDVIKLIEKIEEVAKELDIKAEINAYTPPKKRTLVTDDASIPAAASTNGQATGQAAPAAEPEMKVSYFMISMIGTYPQFLDFLYKLENLGLIVKIESIKTDSLSIFELEKIKTENESLEIVPTLKSNILISYTP